MTSSISTPTPRRDFLKTALAVSAVPLILPSRLWAQGTGPNGRLTMGFIGMGKQNGGLLDNFIGQKDVQVVAVCDVDTTRREHALQRVEARYAKQPLDGWRGCKAYNDFRDVIARDDIDAVCIATPDHWHAIITTAALNAGMDVYCEKPLTHNIAEAVAVMEAVERNGRVLQTGSMQRSMAEFRIACELVRNGVIGKIDRVSCNFGPPGRPCDLPAEEMEPGLDWDLWLGPAPERPYHSVLSPRGNHDHFPAWRDYREYGGGMVTDWGAHHIDIAQWGLGMDDSGPIGVIPPENWQEAKKGAKLRYVDDVTVEHGEGIGVHFFGSEGEIEVTRGRFAFRLGGETVAKFLDRKDGGSLESAIFAAEKKYLKDAKVRLYKSGNHIRDFLDCVKSRKKPITNEIVGGRSAICCHLMNLAYYHGHKLLWDPAANAFAGGTGEEAWLTREYRGEWSFG